MQRKFYYGFLALSIVIGFSSCAPSLENPGPNSGRADFSRTIAIGGTMLSGYQDGALYEEGQKNSIAALIARQLTYVGAAEFKQALLPSNTSLGLNPYPWFSPYQTKSQLGDATDCKGVVSLGPVKNILQEVDVTGTGIFDRYNGELSDFTVPYAGLWALGDRNLGDDHTDLGASAFAARLPFAGNNKSILEAAIEANPSFTIMWPGMQEMWDWAGKGGTGPAMPSASAFRAKLDSVLTALQANGSKGVMATIPDVEDLPFFTTIPPRALTLDSAQAADLNTIYSNGGYNLNFVEGENGFIVADPGSAEGIRQMQNTDFMLLSLPLDSVKCFSLGVLFRLIPDRCSLIESEAASLRATVASYNAQIKDLAAQHDFAVADMASFFGKIESGIRYNAVDFNAQFATGGFFGLDGFGPNPKGAGLIANEFILAINAHYGANVPTISIETLRGILFP